LHVVATAWVWCGKVIGAVSALQHCYLNEGEAA